MREDEGRNYPKFPRPGGFVEASVVGRADETRTYLEKFAFSEDKKYQRMREFVVRSVISTFSEAGIDLRSEDLFKIYLIQRNRQDELKTKTGISGLGKAHRVGKAVHVLVDDGDMLANTYTTLEEVIHGVGTARIVMGRKGHQDFTSQTGLSLGRGETTSGTAIEEGVAGYEPIRILKKAAQEGKLEELGISPEDIDLLKTSSSEQVHLEIARRKNLRPIYHAAFVLVDRLSARHPEIHRSLLRARQSDENRGALVRLIDKVFGKDTAKRIFALDFTHQKQEIEELAKQLDDRQEVGPLDGVQARQ